MSCKVKEILSPGNKSNVYTRTPQSEITIFECFINDYCDQTFSAVALLAGINDVNIISNITIDIFAELWSQRARPFSPNHIGVLLYKTMLRHTLIFLRHQGNEDRIELLRNVLPCKEPFTVFGNL